MSLKIVSSAARVAHGLLRCYRYSATSCAHAGQRTSQSTFRINSPRAQWSCVRFVSGGRRIPPPPPLARKDRRRPTSGSLPPPPPLPNRAGGAPPIQTAVFAMRSPQDVLSVFVDYVPTFFVPLHCVAAILREEVREQFVGRGKLLSFMRRYPFVFDVRVLDSISRCDVRLRPDMSHPRRGAADNKFVMTDVGEFTNYVARPDMIVSTESIDSDASRGVALHPPSAPPAVRVRLEERVPVLDRLRALVPATFTAIGTVEEAMPEDLLFHPYFDCQGGLLAIAGKFPELFQVVRDRVRLRPRDIAPLALDELTLETSPLPEIAALVRRAVCNSDIPYWVSITSLYEQLSRPQKRAVKAHFRSFAGFLRAHGRALSVSSDMLQVAMWVSPRNSPPDAAGDAAESTVTAAAAAKQAPSPSRTSAGPPPPKDLSSGTPARYVFTHVQAVNELFDRFPPHRTLNLPESLALLPPVMQQSVLPKKIVPWLASYTNYFTVENPTETDPQRVRIRRASDRQPLDIAQLIYNAMADRAVAAVDDVLRALPPDQQQLITRIGVTHVVNMLPEWLALEGDHNSPASAQLRRLRSADKLRAALKAEEAKKVLGNRRGQLADEPVTASALGFEGHMSAPLDR